MRKLAFLTTLTFIAACQTAKPGSAIAHLQPTPASQFMPSSETSHSFIDSTKYNKTSLVGLGFDVSNGPVLPLIYSEHGYAKASQAIGFWGHVATVVLIELDSIPVELVHVYGPKNSHGDDKYYAEVGVRYLCGGLWQLETCVEKEPRR